MGGLAEKRLIYVTGKGGVGKSTVAAALGVAAARRGVRTVIAEFNGQRSIPALFGHRLPAAEGEELALSDRLAATTLAPRVALEEYLQQKAGPLGDLLAGSQTFHNFVAATPGMRELLALGKAWELAQQPRRTAGAATYDLVIVDGPATGHGIGVLRTPRTFAEIARVGPIAGHAATLDAAFTDPAFVAIVAVALPEEMPVNETLLLEQRIAAEFGHPLAATVVNRTLPERFGPRQRSAIEVATAARPSTPATRALAAAVAEAARAAEQAAQIDRLAAGIGRRPLELPLLPDGAADREAIAMLAELVEPIV